MLRGIALSSLASIMMVSLALQTPTPPRESNPHGVPGDATSAATCDEIVAYAEDLNTAIGEHETFGGFWSEGDYDSIQQQDRKDIQEIVDDGRALLEDMEALAVPEFYRSGHEGIMLLFDSDIDYITFIGVDAYTVPDFDQWDTGLALILKGEIWAAKECPAEVEELGGFVFISTEDLENALDQ